MGPQGIMFEVTKDGEEVTPTKLALVSACTLSLHFGTGASIGGGHQHGEMLLLCQLIVCTISLKVTGTNTGESCSLALASCRSGATSTL